MPVRGEGGAADRGCELGRDGGEEAAEVGDGETVAPHRADLFSYIYIYIYIYI
jgi:hypothetical protein